MELQSLLADKRSTLLPTASAQQLNWGIYSCIDFVL